MLLVANLLRLRRKRIHRRDHESASDEKSQVQEAQEVIGQARSRNTQGSADRTHLRGLHAVERGRAEICSGGRLRRGKAGRGQAGHPDAAVQTNELPADDAAGREEVRKRHRGDRPGPDAMREILLERLSDTPLR